jgi:tetratricopeptide (TPR) repeat protein
MQAKKINPKFAEAYNGAGAALIRMGEARKAAAFFREAVKIDPDYVAAQNNLKNTLAALGKNN